MLPAEKMPSVNYAVRLRASYEDLRQVVGDWATVADKVLCYQHSERKDNIHCHLLLTGVYQSTDTLKRSLVKHGLALKGAGQLSFKTTFKDSLTKVVFDITDETIPKYITYMTKGSNPVLYNKGYDTDFLEQCRSKWVTYKKSDKDEEMYNEFCQYIYDRKKKELYQADETPTAAAIKIFAVDFVMEKFPLFHSKARQLTKALIDTYNYRFGIVSASMLILPFEPWKKA